MRHIDSIIIHCSDSIFGNASIIDQWHKERGWTGIGYHFVILNGYPVKSTQNIDILDGSIETGRPLDIPGAHVKGHNRKSIGICLIGTNYFSKSQLGSLKLLVNWLETRYPSIEKVQGHYELDSHKTCPNINMVRLRDYLSTGVGLEKLI